MLLPLSLWAQAPPCNDTLVRLRDTVCEGSVYRFGDRQLTHEGVFYDTLPRAAGDCDSVVVLFLAVLPSARAQLHVHNVCQGDVGYKILVGSEGCWFRWWADPPDTAMESLSRNNPALRAVQVNPQQPATYYVFADYSARRQCPDSGHVSVTPLVPVSAKLHVSPAEISVDNLELTLVDQSTGNRDDQWGYCGRVWSLDGVQIDRWGEEEHLRLQLPSGDSLRVALSAYSYTCSDSAVAILPVRRVALYFPNAFMPGAGEEASARFAAVTKGIGDCEVWVYDRRGQLVHHAADARVGWDGRCGGVLCPQGIYTYRCRYTETQYPRSSQTRTGTVLLLR